MVWGYSNEDFVKDYPQRPNVGLDRVIGPFEDLRAHVNRRSNVGSQVAL